MSEFRTAPVPPFVRRKARVLRTPSQAAPNPFEVFKLDDLKWDIKMNAAQLRRVLENRRVPIPADVEHADLVRLLEEHDEAQPKSVMAVLNR